MCKVTVAQILYVRSLLGFMAKDFAGASCKDDSNQGNLQKDRGQGRKSAITYWRHHSHLHFIL